MTDIPTLPMNSWRKDPYRKRLYKAIMGGEDFNTYGALSGRRIGSGHEPTSPSDGYVTYRDMGQLPYSYKRDYIINDPDYVIWSYETPIAWHATRHLDRDIDHYRPADYWVIPDVYYSTTTTRHQNIVRVALSLADVRDRD